MYSGYDPEQLLKIISGRQEEIRAEARREAGARRLARPLQRARLTTFKLWRLHVMVWFEDARRA